MISVEIKNLRILHLIFLSIISIPIIVISMIDIFHLYSTEPDFNVSNPDQRGLEAGVKYIFFLTVFTVGSISAIISFVDLLVEKNKISLINISLAVIIILISFYYK